MQVLKDSLFYSGLRPGLDGGAEEERALMAQEQKACRARARKFSQETNRRRKALEEKRRQLDVQEQKQREAILQQRKQRLQHATERFLRAHLPHSQRSGPASSKRAPNLDEALSHIRGSLNAYSQHSSFFSSASNINRSCSSSSQPQGGDFGTHRMHVVSAAEAYTKLMQERSLSEFKNSQVVFLSQLQESEVTLKHHTSPQVDEEDHDTPVSRTESLSSLDSLENEVPQKDQDRSPTVSFPNVPREPLELNDVRRPSSPQRNLNNPCVLSDHASPKSFLEQVLNQQDNPSSRSSSPSPRESSEDLVDEEQSLEDLIQAVEQCILMGQSQGSHIEDPDYCQNVHDAAANSEYKTYCYDGSAQGNILKDKSIMVTHSKPQTIADTLPLEFSALNQDSDLVSRDQTEECAEQLSKTGTALPVSRLSHGESLFQISSSIALSTNAHTLSFVNSASQPVEIKSPSQTWKSKPGVDGARVQEREAKFECSEEKWRVDPSYPPNEGSDRQVAKDSMPESSKNAEEPDRGLAEPGTGHPASKISNVRFLKGILKQSKYVARDSKSSLIPSHFVFTKQVAMAVRDSVELTRAKAGETERNQNMKKKLRWFDQIAVNEQESEERTKKDRQQAPAKSKLSHHAQQPLVDHQHRSCQAGVAKKMSNTISDSTTDPRSTKQAWTDVELLDGRQKETTEESRVQRMVPCVAAPRIPRRVRSARAAPGAVFSRARKGTIIRAQSASEARHVVRAQGKMIVPRPPPRPDIVEGKTADVCITKGVSNNDYSSSKPVLATEPAVHKVNPDNQSVRQQHILKKDALFANVPSSYTYSYEAVSKAIYALCQPEAQAGGARRWLQGGENGFCLDRTPTDEEISILWHGVRSALASKEGGHQSLTHIGPLSQTNANLAHVAINGDSLFRGIKGIRTNGFILPPSNIRASVRRPSVDGNAINNRTYMDNSRAQTTAPGERKCHLIYQAAVPVNGYPSKMDHTMHDEAPVVMDSSGQVAEGRAQRAGVVVEQQRGRTLGPGALSLEEQRLLQSLDRLNYHLQNVQDMAAGNRVLRGVFETAFNQSPQTGEGLGATLRKNQTGSAENRSRSHRRY